MSRQTEFGGKDLGTWGTVKVSRKGWTVETHSRVHGTRTGSIIFVPFSAVPEIKPGDDLRATWNEGMLCCDYIRYVAASDPRCTVRRRGHIVQ